ncbi:MAG TPA: DUF1810 domain-containing protein [Chthonomonadaceae bacterium]|nr:DUF1810 domain-containing protein [Chthonomonadaceae bacterium]
MDDPYNLQRFVDAQDLVYDEVLSELRAGYKSGHWMWFIFPQIRGLGRSALAEKFAINSKEEAQAYLQHPILGRRLRECTRVLTLLKGRSAAEIFGYPDVLKFKSSMTLFYCVTSENQEFKDALHIYFGNELDQRTIERL